MRIALSVTAILTAYLLLFRFDVRALTGFDLVVQSGPNHKFFFFTSDADLGEEEVVQVWTSKASRCFMSGLNSAVSSSQDYTEAYEGPTIFRFESGKIVVTNGVICCYEEGKREVTLYAQ